MIKKILGSIFIVGLGFLGFSNASFSLGIVGQDATSVENQNYDISILANYEFKTSFGGVNKRLFAPKETEVWWWGTTGNMHFSNVYFTTKYNGTVKYFYLCDYIETLTNFSNCTKYLYSSNLEVVKNILNNVTAGDTFFYGQAGSYMEFNAVSVQSLDQTIVFPIIAIQRSSAPNENTSISAIGISFNGNDCNNIQSGRWVCNLDNYDNSIGYDFSTLPNNLIGVSPGFPAGGGSDDENDIVGIEIGSNESAINYFEKRYGRDSTICYAGIDNLTTLYGSSVSYNAGSGLNLFQVYSGLYNNSDLDKVYVWLNSWLLNYEQWFYYDEPSFLSTYNSGTNQVDLYYDNLTFPFVNNPVAIYFLASNISYNSEYSTMGSEVVSYCNLKINGGSFDDIIDQAVKNNINNYTEQSNKNNGLNPDGTQKIIDFSGFGSYTGDAWVSSGIDIDFSGDTTLKSSIRNFFERVDVLFGDTIEIENNTSVGSILPSYIVYAFLFIVLFKFLRRR